MANYRLILRTVNSGFPTPFQDTTLNSVLSHTELDNNFITLKRNLIYTGTTNGTILSLEQIGGESIDLDLSGIVSSSNFYTTGATLIDNIAYFDRTDTLSAYTLNLSGLTGGGSADTFITTATTSGNTLILTRNDGVDISVELPSSSGGTGGTSCPSGLTIYDEGTLVKTDVCEIDFVGADVRTMDTGGNKVTVYVPAPEFASHWNTTDGTTNGVVSENISRVTARMSTPNGGEGSPFYIGTWAGTNQQATNGNNNTTGSFIFTSSQDVTGFGGDSTMKVDVYVGSDVLLQTYTTPPITGNTTYTDTSGITVNIVNYSGDSFGIKYKCKPTITVDMTTIIPNGSKVRVVVTHTTDSTTDGGNTYTYTQNYVFYDNNPNTPQINGDVVISETSGQILTKHISGIEYYILGSDFTIEVTDIDDLNLNSQATSNNLTLTATEFGLPTLTPEPFNFLAANFSGWTNDNDNLDTGFNYDNWGITSSNYRFRDVNANATARPKDRWSNGSLQNSPNNSILIDTYTDNSTDLNETFNGESKRYTDSGFTTTWDSTVALVDGQALVMGGQMMIPSVATRFNGSSNTGPNADWSSYKPDLNGSNPDYSLLSNPSSFYRKFQYGDTITDLSNFTMTFTGSFAGGNALTDLQNSDLEIFIRRISSNDGTALTGTTAPANNLHGASYNSGSYDQGVLDGQIRTGTSSGNVITGTFGTWSATDGFYCEIKINNSSIKLSSIQVTFNG